MPKFPDSADVKPSSSDLEKIDKMPQEQLEINDTVDWADYFNADIFELYSPTNPLIANTLLDSCLEEGDRHDYDNSDNFDDFFGSAGDFHNGHIGTIMNAIGIKKEDNVDRDIMVESDPSSFGQNADMSIFSFNSKSCALQHLVANNFEACSETPAESAPRIDLTSELTFDDATMRMLAKYFKVSATPNDVNSAQECINPAMLQSILDNPANTAEAAAEDITDREPCPFWNNHDLHKTNYMNDMGYDSLNDEDRDEDEENLVPEDIVRHYWISNTNDIKFQVRHRQTYLYLTAKQLEDRFGCINITIWTHWKEKSKRTVGSLTIEDDPTWKLSASKDSIQNAFGNSLPTMNIGTLADFPFK
ncbi:hypothetical protein QFC24_006948 [Naganishia onofrii]|uniref:Uncharacterized protein n=1 Tax=Naganishia onofrii TaxID=1851511 RepID=A0ACC2WUU3_9TREE|nr:hypothetical protein QFC24_006948 [Naganishia onofrii]